MLFPTTLSEINSFSFRKDSQPDNKENDIGFSKTRFDTGRAYKCTGVINCKLLQEPFTKQPAKPQSLT